MVVLLVVVAVVVARCVKVGPGEVRLVDIFLREGVKVFEPIWSAIPVRYVFKTNPQLLTVYLFLRIFFVKYMFCPALYFDVFL